VFREASFLGRSSVERFDPEGRKKALRGVETGCNLRSAGNRRETTGNGRGIRPASASKPNGVKESGIERVSRGFQCGSEEAGQEH